MAKNANPKWIEYLKTVDSPTLANGIELLKVRARREGFTSIQIRQIFPEMGRMCGYAVTAHVETVTESEPFDLQGFIDLYRAVEQSPKPAVVAFQEIGGHPDYAAHCGEVMSTVFKRLGAIGLVSDCGVRDIPEVRAMGFQYFARGTVVSHANFRIVRTGVPIHICGMVVRTGEIVHADENGVLTIPDGVEDKLPPAVDSVRTREGHLMEWIRSDKFSLDQYRHYCE